MTVSDDFGPLVRAAKGGTRLHIVFVPPALGWGEKQKDKKKDGGKNKKTRRRNGQEMRSQIQRILKRQTVRPQRSLLFLKQEAEHTRRAHIGSTFI